MQRTKPGGYLLYGSTRIIQLLVLLPLVPGCQTAEELPKTTPINSNPIVQEMTVLPDQFERGLATFQAAARIQVPGEMVARAIISRPRAELRKGPGTQFEISDTILLRDTLVYVFEYSGVWRKVIVPSEDLKGWVHFRVIQSHPVHAKIEFDLAQLPTVLATRAVKRAFSYPEKETIDVAIPRGAMFYFLQRSEAQTLVWLSTTNSVMWLSSKDVQ